MMTIRGWRSISDYKQIMSLQNVTLIHPSVKSDYVIKKSSLVVGINTTSTLEAGYYNKPSITLSDQDFSYLPFVYKLKTLHDLPDAIKTSLKKKVNISDLNNYFNLIESNSFEINLWDLSTNFDNIFHYGRFLVNVEISINKMQSFLEKYSNSFEKLAAEFIKKIQNC